MTDSVLQLAGSSLQHPVIIFLEEAEQCDMQMIGPHPPIPIFKKRKKKDHQLHQPIHTPFSQTLRDINKPTKAVQQYPQLSASQDEIHAFLASCHCRGFDYFIDLTSARETGKVLLESSNSASSTEGVSAAWERSSLPSSDGLPKPL